MSITITHNLMAMNAGRIYSANNVFRAKSAEKLSSGYKINRAGDDAAGLTISEKMRRQIRGLKQGVQNTQEGISLCQVADGALAEVNEILNRVTQLSIKAANETNSEIDRQAIQKEIHQLMSEINRIGNTTQFNKHNIFKGSDIYINGSTMVDGGSSFDDFSLMNESPFGPGAHDMQLQAIANGESYNLIFDYNILHTSLPSFRLSDGEIVEFKDLTPSPTRSGVEANGNPYWTRDFIYQKDGVGIKITQRVSADKDTTGVDEKNYHISFSFENIGNVDVSMDFMFHLDTAYGGVNDSHESYFVNSNLIEEACIYSQPGSSFTAGQTDSSIIEGIPDSFSIVDVVEPLAFSEKVSFRQGKPDSLSIGNYEHIRGWNYYETLGNNWDKNLNDDYGFSLLWKLDMRAGGSRTVGFDYGIARTESDPNLQDVPLQGEAHNRKRSFWIQSGAEEGDGLWLEFNEMNTSALGISRLDVTTTWGAGNAIASADKARHRLLDMRSYIGAQQNRMEHIIANENNNVENTTAAESRIRDTDMAEEMVRNATSNILQQAAQAMLTQANQQPNYVLQLLQ